MTHPAMALLLEDETPAPVVRALDRQKRDDESWADYRAEIKATMSPGLTRNVRPAYTANSIEVQLGLREIEDGGMNGTGARSCG